MSRLSDYAKFDNIIDSDDERENQDSTVSTKLTVGSSRSACKDQTKTGNASTGMIGQTKAGSEAGRYIFEVNGQKVYEWDQSLEGRF